MTVIAMIDLLVRRGVRFATGVPDSLLASFINEITWRGDIQHTVAANEGAAVALAAGHYLATGQMPLVYLQNSGLPNAMNPYLSMCHPSVYDLPMIFVVGWRGEPGRSDEPQHRTIGSATERLLEIMDIPIVRLGNNGGETLATLDERLGEGTSRKGSVAILVSAGAITGAMEVRAETPRRQLARQEALRELTSAFGPEDAVFAGIGHVGRELLSIRQASEGGEEYRESLDDFLCVGGMGHASQFALGFALASPHRRIWCLDGDGSLTMHMGAPSVVSRLAHLRLVHILFDNGVHASVGGQEISGCNIDFGSVAKALGYQHVAKVDSIAELKAAVSTVKRHQGPSFLWLKVGGERPSNLPRPVASLMERRKAFRSRHSDGRSQ